MRQFAWVGLQEGPELNSGQLDAEVFVGAAFATLAGWEPPTVPPESLQVQKVLRDVAMPGLLHADDAIHAFNQAASPNDVRKYVADTLVSSPISHTL